VVLVLEREDIKHQSTEIITNRSEDTGQSNRTLSEGAIPESPGPRSVSGIESG
jgi:hypothetical protein